LKPLSTGIASPIEHETWKIRSSLEAGLPDFFLDTIYQTGENRYLIAT
jgi:hypothetical protein